MTAPRLSIAKFFVLLLAAALAMLVLVCLLPQDRYIRFRDINEPAVVKAGWIYERIHFDPTPIDTVFIGTSHSVFGIDSARVEQSCRLARGHRCASVNLALQHLGRDLHWLIAREVLETRKPKLLLIEVQEREPRAMHPAFPYLADALDIVTAPLLINLDYFPSLARLPLRQLSLFAKSASPSLFGVRSDFDPAFYRGAHWDDTWQETGTREHPIKVQPRTRIHSAAELEAQRAHALANEGGAPKLPRSLRWLEYRATLIYLYKIIALAKEKGVSVRFVYLPSFDNMTTPEFLTDYEKSAPLWQMPAEIRARPEYWLDVGHLNAPGAQAFSRWLGEQVAKER
jgi:hypothetical protein